MRYLLVLLSLLLCPVIPAQAQISVNIELPGLDIGINMPVYPRLVRVPGYPVYYDPQVNSNYFFYDGLYWVYQSDNWYASSWYNGPWELVDPYDVPLYLLRIPVRYYRHPPTYFHGWSADAPPRWGEHWGNDWEKRRSGWDQWNRRSVPAPAPLPTYQRQYSGDRYPRAPEQQVTIRDRNYRYQPREAVTQQHFQKPAARAQQAPVQRSPSPQQGSQPSQPRQQPQALQRKPERPAQQAQPVQPAQQQAQRKQPVQQAQPRAQEQVQRKQPPAQAQHALPAPQGKAPEQKPAPQGKAPEQKPVPQGKAPEKKPAPQGKGREGKAEPQGEGPQNKKEERDSGRQ